MPTGKVLDKFGIVKDHFGLDPRVGDRRLATACGLAKDARRFRSRIGRGHDDLRQIRAQRDGLAKPGGRTAADRDEAIRPQRGEKASAASVMSTGVCIVAPSKTPAQIGPSASANSSASAD